VRAPEVLFVPKKGTVEPWLKSMEIYGSIPLSEHGNIWGKQTWMFFFENMGHPL
jgi:hypothetical protein